jgi:hypothetical protein
VPREGRTGRRVLAGINPHGGALKTEAFPRPSCPEWMLAVGGLARVGSRAGHHIECPGKSRPLMTLWKSTARGRQRRNRWGIERTAWSHDRFRDCPLSKKLFHRSFIEGTMDGDTPSSNSRSRLSCLRILSGSFDVLCDNDMRNLSPISRQIARL